MTTHSLPSPEPVNNVLLWIYITSVQTPHYVMVWSVQLNQIGDRFVVTTHFNDKASVLSDTDNKALAESAYREYAKGVAQMSTSHG